MACGERLLKKLDQTERAFMNLKEIPSLEGSLDRKILYEVSAKRFEYTYEILWKTARLFLLEQKGIECNSPMDCFKTLYSVGLIDERFEKVIPKIVRFRNEIVHIYDFSLAENTYNFIVGTVKEVFDHIISRLKEACKDTLRTVSDESQR